MTARFNWHTATVEQVLTRVDDALAKKHCQVNVHPRWLKGFLKDYLALEQQKSIGLISRVDLQTATVEQHRETFDRAWCLITGIRRRLERELRELTEQLAEAEEMTER